MEIKRIMSIALVLSPLLIIPFLLSNAYADTTIYDVTRNTGYVLGDNNGANGFNEVVGERITSASNLTGSGFSKITVWLSKCAGCNSGALIYIGVWNFSLVPTSSNMLKQIGTINSSSLSEAHTQYSFTFSGYNIPTNGNVVIGVGRFTVPNSADSSGANTGNLFDGTNSHLARYETSWNTNTAQDFAMKLEIVSGSSIEFCQQPENINLLRCRLEAQGGALGGNFANNPFDISSSTSDILVQTGFLDGSDTNPATNGTGYLLLAIALIIATVLLWIGTNGQAFITSNLYIVALISLAIVAGFTIAGLVEPSILIISIVVLVALASPKIVTVVSGLRGSGGNA